MITRKMNTRITIFKKMGGQNEDGEVIDSLKVDVLTCWAEVQRTSVKDFKAGGKTYVGELAQNGQKPLESFKDIKVFLVRYMPKPPFDNSMYVNFNGFEYKITEIEVDYASKDIIMIKGERVS